MYASELANKLDITEKQVIDIKHEFHLKTKELIVGKVFEIDFTAEDAKFVEKTVLERRAQKAKADAVIAAEKEKVFQSNLAKMKAEHPLVKDERCFRLSWWPETIPSVLDEGDDE